jgi:hypothetical protein
MNFYAEAALKIKDDLDNCICRLVNTYFVDQSVPLDERWEVYTKVSTLLPINSDYVGNVFEKVLGDISLYDEFNIDRYQTALYVDQVESLECDLEYAEEEANVTYAEPREVYVPAYNRKQITQIKEAVLASGTQGFIYDW